MVMQFQYDPHGYASALLMLEKTNHLSKPLAVAAAGKKNDLLHRVELILGVHKKTIIPFNKVAGLFASLLCVIALNALLILSKPVKGNETISFSSLTSPLYFFGSDDENGASQVMSEIRSTPVINHSQKTAGIVKEKNILQPPAPSQYHFMTSPSNASA